MNIFHDSSSSIQKKIKQGLINKCFEVLIEGYESMVDSGIYDLSWDEEKLTAHLIFHMEKSDVISRYAIDISPEPRVYDRDIIFGDISPKKASKPDIRISLWKLDWQREHTKLLYFIEAKNLSEKNWIKKNGSSVKASYYKKRYIEKGIDQFIEKKYPNGCMAAYIVQGNIRNIVEDINKILENSSPPRSREMIKKNSDWSHCYKSNHSYSDKKEFELYHFMLKF